MKSRQALSLWLLTAFAGSLLLVIGAIFFHGNKALHSESEEIIAAIFLAVFISLLVMIPAFIVYRVLGGILYRREDRQASSKLLLSVYAFFAAWFSALFLAMVAREIIPYGNPNAPLEMGPVFCLSLPYAIAFISGIWLLVPAGEKKIDIPENDMPPGNVAETAFPEQSVAIIAVLMLLTNCWKIYSATHSHNDDITFEKIAPPFLFIIQLTGFILLIRRRAAGWYLLVASAILSVFSGIANIFMNHATDTASLMLIPADVIVVILLLKASLRRHFAIPAQKRNAAIIIGILLGMIVVFTHR